MKYDSFICYLCILSGLRGVLTAPFQILLKALIVALEAIVLVSYSKVHDRFNWA